MKKICSYLFTLLYILTIFTGCSSKEKDKYIGLYACIEYIINGEDATSTANTTIELKDRNSVIMNIRGFENRGTYKVKGDQITMEFDNKTINGNFVEDRIVIYFENNNSNQHNNDIIQGDGIYNENKEVYAKVYGDYNAQKIFINDKSYTQYYELFTISLRENKEFYFIYKTYDGFYSISVGTFKIHNGKINFYIKADGLVFNETHYFYNGNTISLNLVSMGDKLRADLTKIYN